MIGNNEYVEKILATSEVARIGFADLSEIEEETRYGFPYGVCIAVALTVFPGIAGPKKEYYDEYRRVSGVLRETSNNLAEKIKERGYRAYSLAMERQDDRFRTQLPYKTLATRAGLGWIGKSATLVTKEYGNAIRLNGVLTDMPFVTGTPINESLCGGCEECVKRCPGTAISGRLWRLGIDRDELLNPAECKKTVIRRGERWDVTEGSCGVCISVCPYTRQYKNKMQSEAVSCP